MRSRLLVLGAGEVGTACALSLLANIHAREAQVAAGVTMCARDREYLHELQCGSRTFRPFDKSLGVPSQMSFKVMGEEVGNCEALFLCLPMSCLAKRKENASMKEGEEQEAASASSAVHELLGKHTDTPTFVFTRGFSRDGLTAQEELNGCVSSKLSKLVTVSGPLFAKEWAAASVLKKDSTDSSSNDSNNNNNNSNFHEISCNNGVSLAFAMSDDTDRETLHSVRDLTNRLWRRESVTWLTEPKSAGVLSFVNGCFPLCCMGAGMVSSEYPASVSAMMSYMQHAINATELLVNEVFSRPRGTPLPACAVTTLAMACTNHASREFVFGRRLNYYFRHRDAIRGVFPGNSHESLDATVAGLHTLLQQRSLQSPFYEVLMDAFLTVLRASVAGKGLVKTGCYDYRHNLQAGDSLFLQHALEVDKAMLSGDEEAFNRARQAFEDAFSNSATSASSSSSSQL